MRNVRIRLSYDGSRFYGWQRQDGFVSVQQVVEEAVLGVTGEVVSVHGAGRTDTGVHALGQVAHFHVATRLDDERLSYAVNAHLPEGVSVACAETCREDFHARFHARSKRYAYAVRTARFRPALGRQYSHWVHSPLDLHAMRRAGRDLVGRHDFAAFGNQGSPRATTVRHVHGLRILSRARGLLIVIQADGFLYNMVRTIAGTLLEVGRGRLDERSVARAIESGDRDDAGPTAPPEGLYLVSVQYDERTFQSAACFPRRRAGAMR